MYYLSSRVYVSLLIYNCLSSCTIAFHFILFNLASIGAQIVSHHLYMINIFRVCILCKYLSLVYMIVLPRNMSSCAGHCTTKLPPLINYTLEKTEEAIMNGQSRETCNTGYTKHRKKTNKTHKRNT